jgi:hypothetical protein
MIYISVRGIFELELNWKAFGRKCSYPKKLLSRKCCGRPEGNHFVFRKASVPAEIQTQHLPNKSNTVGVIAT